MRPSLLPRWTPPPGEVQPASRRTTAKKDLVAYTRLIVRSIQGTLTVTDQQRHDLGITVRKTEGTPIPVPSEIPVVEVIARFGNVVKVALHDGTGVRRKRPALVQGAGVYTFVGAAAPTDPTLFVFQGMMTKSVVDIAFADELPAGTKIWITAFYYNAKGQQGFGAVPVSTVLAGGGVLTPNTNAESARMKMAA